MDVVYFYRDCFFGKDAQLKSSLRSIEKNAINAGEIYVIGDKVNFNVKNILTQKSLSPTFDQYEKINCILGLDNFPDRFILMDDDYYITQNIDLNKLPCTYSGDLAGRLDYGSNEFRECVVRTMEFLNKNNFNSDCYDLHTPQIIETAKLEEMLMKFPDIKNDLLLYKSCYFNIFPCSKKLRMEDRKINSDKNISRMISHFDNSQFVSSGLEYANEKILKLVESKFTEKSKYEFA